LDILQLLSPIRKLIYLLSNELLRLVKIFKIISNTNKNITKYNKIVLEKYIKFIDITLAIKLPINLTRNLFVIFEIKYSKSISFFEIGFVIVIYVILLFNNKKINITQKSLYQQQIK
jgi:hypothetical protein